MQKTWMTHLPHFLDEHGGLPLEFHASARRMLKALCKFVAYATNFDGEGDELPQCFMVSKRKRCRGKVTPLISMEDDAIIWHCFKCGSGGCISGWQGTLWDLSEHFES
ncbi:hypothetical protein SCL28_16820, partial [Legionella pneumophila serogroup 1]